LSWHRDGCVKFEVNDKLFFTTEKGFWAKTVHFLGNLGYQTIILTKILSNRLLYILTMLVFFSSFFKIFPWIHFGLNTVLFYFDLPKVKTRSNFLQKSSIEVDDQFQFSTGKFHPNWWSDNFFYHRKSVSKKCIKNTYDWKMNIFFAPLSLTPTSLKILILLLKYFVTMVIVPSSLRIDFRIGVDIKYHWIQI